MHKIERSRRGQETLSILSTSELRASGGSPTLPLPPPREVMFDPQPNPWRPVFVGSPVIGY
jgi:hypothetical protein